MSNEQKTLAKIPARFSESQKRPERTSTVEEFAQGRPERTPSMQAIVTSTEQRPQEPGEQKSQSRPPRTPPLTNKPQTKPASGGGQEPTPQQTPKTKKKNR